MSAVYRSDDPSENRILPSPTEEADARSKRRRARIVAVVIALAILATVGSIIWAVTTNQSRACVVADIVHDQIAGEIQRNQALEKSGGYDKLFPGLPSAQLHALLATQREQQLAEEGRLERVCGNLGPEVTTGPS